MFAMRSRRRQAAPEIFAFATVSTRFLCSKSESGSQQRLDRMFLTELHTWNR